MRVVGVLANLLYPPACLVCHGRMPTAGLQRRAGSPQTTPPICAECLGAMARNGPPACSRCGLALPGAFDATLECAACRAVSPAFALARSPWQYAGPLREAVREFKYHRRWRIGRWLADEMAALAQSAFPLDEIAAVLPVPLHWLKERLRGANAVGQLARPIATALGKPYLPSALRRTRWTRAQTDLSWRERRQNVQRAFVARPRGIQGKAVVLVDDVLTSGATANACALALREAGARRVFVLAAARTPLNIHAG